MPLDFPNSPVDGDTFTSTGKVWVYVAAINAWEPKPQAVAWDDLTGTLDSVQFDLTPTSDTFSIGETKWNAEEGCLAYGVEGGDISIGKEIWENYTDLDGDIVEGDVVSVVGASGNRSAVRKTNATSATSAAAVLGIVTNVNADNTVRVTEFGRVHKLNTGGYAESALLYVNPAANGKWTDVKPTAPNYAVEIGVVEVAHAVNGVVAARCRSVTFPSANIIDLSSATVGALSFGAGNEVVSMSAVADVATFVFGANAKDAFLTALGATTTGKAALTAENAAALATTAGVGATDSPMFANCTLYPSADSVQTLTIKNAANASAIRLGTLGGSPTYGSIWFGTNTATFSNAALNGDNSNTILNAATSLSIRVANVSKITLTTGAVLFVTPPRPPTYTVSTTPASVGTGLVTGAIILISDALTPAIGSAVVAGGAQLVTCQYNGTNWIVIAILT